jgi:hypothetical protein
VTNAIASVTDEDKLWSKFDWDVESKTGATLRKHISFALELSHSRYSKLKKLTNTQQEEKDTIELGMLSIMQMHYDETGAEVAKNWKHSFQDIYTVYTEELMNSQKSIDSEMIDTSEDRNNAPAPIKANADTRKDRFILDSSDDDDDDEQITPTKQGYSVYDDEEVNDDHDTITLMKIKVLQPLATINLIKSLQQQTNQMQIVTKTKKAPQIYLDSIVGY